MVDSNHNLAVTSSNPPKRILRRIQAHPRPLDRPDASMRAPFCSPNESRNPGVCMCSCTHKKPTETPTKQFIKSSWRNLRSGLFPTAPPTHQDVSTPADAGQLPRAEQVRGVGGGGLRCRGRRLAVAPAALAPAAASAAAAAAALEAMVALVALVAALQRRAAPVAAGAAPTVADPAAALTPRLLLA